MNKAKEQEFALSDEKYSNLLRDVDELGEIIDPWIVQWAKKN